MAEALWVPGFTGMADDRKDADKAVIVLSADTEHAFELEPFTVKVFGAKPFLGEKAAQGEKGFIFLLILPFFAKNEVQFFLKT